MGRYHWLGLNKVRGVQTQLNEFGFVSFGVVAQTDIREARNSMSVGNWVGIHNHEFNAQYVAYIWAQPVPNQSWTYDENKPHRQLTNEMAIGLWV